MTIATVDLGKIKFQWKGDWSSSASYTRDDVVHYQGQAYVCKLANTNSTPAVGSSDWDLLAAGGDPATVMTNQGDLLVRGAGGLERLAAPAGHQALVSDSGQPVWQPAWRMISNETTIYSGGISAAPHPNRAWIPGMYADFTPTSATSKIFIHAQFAHSDSGVGAITLAHVYRDANLFLSTNISGHNFYVARWNSISYWFDSWGLTSSRVGIQGSKYSSSYNIYWHSSGYTGADESPSNGSPHSIARKGLFTIQEWEPAS